MHFLCVLLALVSSNVGNRSEPVLKFGLLGLSWCLLVGRDVASFLVKMVVSTLLDKAIIDPTWLCSDFILGLILCRLNSSQEVC